MLPPQIKIDLMFTKCYSVLHSTPASYLGISAQRACILVENFHDFPLKITSERLAFWLHIWKSQVQFISQRPDLLTAVSHGFSPSL
jgi:hypothetical protein